MAEKRTRVHAKITQKITDQTKSELRKLANENLMTLPAQAEQSVHKDFVATFGDDGEFCDDDADK